MACGPTSAGGAAERDSSCNPTCASLKPNVKNNSSSNLGNDEYGCSQASCAGKSRSIKKICPHPCPPELGNALASSRASPRKVRFKTPVVTAVWEADADYDRKSIVVDLSKTPFALLRKDAVLMAKPPALASTSPLKLGTHKRSSPSPTNMAICAGPPNRGGTDISPKMSAPADDNGIVQASPEANSECRSDVFGSWDSEESDYSTVTDTETDAEHSDTDCNPCCERCSVEPAFFGVWKRMGSEGYDILLLSSGVPEHAIAAALRKHPIHIIDHDGQYFRLIVKNGLSKVDNTFFIGDEPRMEVMRLLEHHLYQADLNLAKAAFKVQVMDRVQSTLIHLRDNGVKVAKSKDKIGKQLYEISLNWVDLSGNGQRDELALSSICEERGEEVIAIRSLTDGGNGMVLTQIVRRPAQNFEVRAKHFFKRVTDRSELRGSAPAPRSITVRRRKT